MTKIDVDLNDFTNAALKRMVRALLVANEDEEKQLLSHLAAAASKKPKVPKPEKNELADLKEQTRGRAPKIEVEDDEDLEDS